MGISMAVGIARVMFVRDASGSGRLSLEALLDGMGEKDFSESVVVEDGGDVLPAPPQPKKEPSLEAPGDFGAFCIVVLESYES